MPYLIFFERSFKLRHSQALYVFVLSDSYVTGFKKSYTPPGTKKVLMKENGVLYVDKREITNNDWFFYMDFQLSKFGKNSDQYLNTLPNDSIWKSVYTDEELSNYRFFSDKLNKEKGIKTEYQHYPVIGISYEQVLKYSAWRDRMVAVANKANGDDVTVKYRLPKLEELEFLSADCEKSTSSNEIYGYADSNKKNEIKGICDNVSEMIKDDSTFFYGDNKSIVGFRLVAEISYNK